VLYGEANITQAMREMAQAHLYSVTCTCLRETPRLLPLTEQMDLRNMTPLSEITCHSSRVWLSPPLSGHTGHRTQVISHGLILDLLPHQASQASLLSNSTKVSTSYENP
jgi:hypothetical protein